MRLTLRFKGGPGSGFHGHKGRPGQVGGSSGSIDYSFVEINPYRESKLKYDRQAYLRKVGNALEEMPLDKHHIDTAGHVKLDIRDNHDGTLGGSFGNTIQIATEVIEGKYGDKMAYTYRYAPSVLHGIVAHEFGHHFQRRQSINKRQEWTELVKDTKLFESFRNNKLPDYDMENFGNDLRASELFADTFAMYMYEPTLLPDKVYDYMESLND